MMPSLIVEGAQIGGGSPHSARAAWATATAWYVLGYNLQPLFQMMRSTNGSDWIEVDGAHRPSFTNEISYSSWLHADGCIYAFYPPADPGIYRIRRFDTATDLWDTSDFTGVDVSVNVSDQASVRIVLTSNNEIICFYQNITTLEPTYRRWDGATWSAETSIAAVDGRPLDAIVDGSDRVVMYYANATANTTQVVTLDMSSTLSTITTIDAAAHTTTTWAAHMCRFNDGTDDRIALLSRNASGAVDCYTGIEGATLSSITTTTGLSTGTVNREDIGITAFAGNLYALWSDYTAFATISTATSTSLTPPAFAPEEDITPGGGILFGPQWISGLGSLGFCYMFNDVNTGLTNLYVEWLVQPDGYQPWPANDISQIVATATREQQ